MNWKSKLLESGQHEFLNGTDVWTNFYFESKLKNDNNQNGKSWAENKMSEITITNSINFHFQL
jgi:hypothetical protein